MDVDPPFPHPSLKRSCSAPMISECDPRITVASSATTTTNSTASARGSPTFILGPSFETRTRRFSASFSPLHSPGTPGSPCIPSRVSQLKQEEACDIAGREVASEKEFQSALQISQSWEDLSLSEIDAKECKPEPHRRPSSACTEPIHVALPTTLTPFVSSPYPSPTRVSGRQCFSPSMQIPVRNTSFSPTPSPSPTRKTFYTSRRSLSPIAIRPSPLGPVKRKCDLDDRSDLICVPNKKHHFSPAYVSTHGGPLLVTQITSSSDTADSPNGSSSNISAVVPTPDSLSISSIDSPVTLSPSSQQICKLLDSRGNSPSPAQRCGNMGGVADSNSSSSSNSSTRSRERSVCVIPSPLASVVDDSETEPKNGHILKERKDFSHLFVPIPPSPGAMDCCTTDVEDLSNNGISDKNLNLDSKESRSCSEYCDGLMEEAECISGGLDEHNMAVEDPGIVLSQEHSMSVDSSHSPFDPSI